MAEQSTGHPSIHGAGAFPGWLNSVEERDVMKILVNATPLLNIPTGIGRYLKSLYMRIHLQYPEIKIKYFDGHDICNEMPHSPADRSLWPAAVNMAWRLPAMIPYSARRLIHEKRSKRFLKLSKGFDIYHEAGYFPFKAAKNVKTIFTIHDLSLKTLPGFHPKERVLFFSKYFERFLPYADAIITPSEFTKTEIRKEYPLLHTKITPVHLGFVKDVFSRRPEKTVDELKLKMKLPEKYILFVGTADPRKNIQSIVAALDLLPESVKLVCAGWAGWAGKTRQNPLAGHLADKIAGVRHRLDQSSRIAGKESRPTKWKPWEMGPRSRFLRDKACGRNDDQRRIVLTGYLTDHDLAVLYSGARAFVYPSFYEGFGLPVLEAMACGCPVVCSNTASLPEVAGNAALLCSPKNINCLADSIDQIFTSDDLYSEMCLKSLAQAEKFSWAGTAAKTVNVFNDTIQR